jgi:hypothetical protein
LIFSAGSMNTAPGPAERNAASSRRPSGARPAIVSMKARVSASSAASVTSSGAVSAYSAMKAR